MSNLIMALVNLALFCQCSLCSAPTDRENIVLEIGQVIEISPNTNRFLDGQPWYEAKPRFMIERCKFGCLNSETGLFQCPDLDTRGSIERFIKVSQKMARDEVQRRRPRIQNCIRRLKIELPMIYFGVQGAPADPRDNYVTLPSNVRIETMNLTVTGRQMVSIKAMPNSALIVHGLMKIETKEEVSISLEKFTAREVEIIRKETTRKDGGFMKFKSQKEYPQTKLEAKEAVVSDTVKMLGFHPDFTSFEGSWTCGNGVQYVYNMGQSVKNEPIQVQGPSSQQSTHGGRTQVTSQHQEDQEDAEAGGSTTEEAQEDEDYDEEH